MHEKNTVLIAEDHLVQRRMLEDYCTKFGWLVVDSVSSGTRIISEFIANKPDLILLDINLDKTDGISAIKDLKERGYDPNIIFVTGSVDPQHFKAGFELNSIDYILKPYTSTDIEKALYKVQQKISEKRRVINTPEKELHFIFVRQNRRKLPINEAYIVYIEIIDGSTKIVMNDGQIIDSTSTLSEILEQSTDLLFKPHRSFIINTTYIKKIEPDTVIEGNFLIHLDTSFKNDALCLSENYRVLDCIPLTRRQHADWMQRIILRVR